MMTSSDIIAIVAVIVSASVSVITLVFSYKTNKANIDAKRLEIAFEKQLGSFREIVEKIGKIRYIAMTTPISDNDNLYDTLRKANNEFYFSYQKQRVYLPPTIAKTIREYGNYISDFISRKASLSKAEFLLNIEKKESEIVFLIHKFVGYKDD